MWVHILEQSWQLPASWWSWIKCGVMGELLGLSGLCPQMSIRSFSPSSAMSSCAPWGRLRIRSWNLSKPLLETVSLSRGQRVTNSCHGVEHQAGAGCLVGLGGPEVSRCCRHLRGGQSVYDVSSEAKVGVGRCGNEEKVLSALPFSLFTVTVSLLGKRIHHGQVDQSRGEAMLIRYE